MKNLGLMFRDKREEMHLTLKEVENATSIKMMYLQAIEEGKIEKYLSAVYALGFIKQYATFLGFDAEKIIKENAKIFQMYKETPEFEYGLGSIDMRNKSKSSSKKKSNVFWTGISIILLITAWFFSKALGVI